MRNEKYWLTNANRFDPSDEILGHFKFIKKKNKNGSDCVMEHSEIVKELTFVSCIQMENYCCVYCWMLCLVSNQQQILAKWNDSNTVWDDVRRNNAKMQSIERNDIPDGA